MGQIDSSSTYCKGEFRITFTETNDSNFPTAYVASKLAMAEFARLVARDRPDLRVLIVLPGPVKTGLFLGGKSDQLLAKIEDAVGILSPSEFAQTVFQHVIPQFNSQPSGAAAKVYKRAGVEWVDVREYLAAPV